MTFEVWSIIPFVIMLGAIAVFPLMPSMAHRWEKFGFQLAFALILGGVSIWSAAGGKKRG